MYVLAPSQFLSGQKLLRGGRERKFKEFRIVYFVGPDWPLRLFKRAFLPFESNEVFMLFLSTN